MGSKREWQLRGLVQHHRRLSYVFSGSKPHLIRRMLGKGRAFYGLVDKLSFGPIDPDHLASWIDRRMRSHGVSSQGAGSHAIVIAGPRTRDVVRLARKTFDVARVSGAADRETVKRGSLEILQEEDDPLRSLWEGLTAHQQNVLRAVAAAEEGLTTAATLRRFSLSSSAAVSQTANRFVEEGVLERGGPSGYRFDSPFMRGWVVLNALPDVGVHLPPEFRPGEPSDSSSS